MREIKCRGRRIDTGKWVYGHYFIAPLTDENSGTTPDAGWFFLTGEKRHCIESDGVVFTVDEKTVGEYTGLKDKNGKEIWEGDIVRYTPKTTSPQDLFIVFECGAFLQKFPADIGCDPDVYYNWGEIEVIGNVYENPELIQP